MQQEFEKAVEEIYLFGNYIIDINIDPIKVLVYTAVINGIIAVPILFAVIKIANDKQILKDNTNSHVSNVIGWLTFVIMSVSLIIMLVTWVRLALKVLPFSREMISYITYHIDTILMHTPDLS